MKKRSFIPSFRPSRSNTFVIDVIMTLNCAFMVRHREREGDRNGNAHPITARSPLLCTYNVPRGRLEGGQCMIAGRTRREERF